MNKQAYRADCLEKGLDHKDPKIAAAWLAKQDAAEAKPPDKPEIRNAPEGTEAQEGIRAVSSKLTTGPGPVKDASPQDMMSNITDKCVAVLATKYLVGFPKPGPGAASYMTLGEAFEGSHETDAHFAQYSVPGLPLRINQDALDLPDFTLDMRIFAVDVDAPGHKATDEWRLAERAKIAQLYASLPPAYYFETKGGYRLLWLLPPGITLKSREDVVQWRAHYLSCLHYLARVFAIHGDEACSDPTRVFRLPRVVRDGEHQNHLTSPNVNPTGFWNATLAQEDIVHVEALHGTAPVALPLSDIPDAPADVVGRAQKYADAIPGERESFRDKTTYQVACECVRFGLSPEQAAPIVASYAARCMPPFTDNLAHKVQRAYTDAGHQLGERDADAKLFREVKDLGETKPANFSGCVEHQIKIQPLSKVRGIHDALPKRRFLLTDERGEGYGVRGDTAILSAPGGVGKSSVAMQLAIAVILQKHWMGFNVNDRDLRVAFFAAEDSESDVAYAIEQACNAFEYSDNYKPSFGPGQGPRPSTKLTDEEKQIVFDRLHVVPLRGKDPRLISKFERTALLSDMIEQLGDLATQGNFDWGLVVLDPMIRFASEETELNPVAAYASVQAVETFGDLPGKPLVLVAHHSTKSARENGKSDSRGSAAIRDAFRSEFLLDCEIDGSGNETLSLRSGKQNKSKPFVTRMLARCGDACGGCLRLAAPVTPEAAALVESVAKEQAYIAQDLAKDAAKSKSAAIKETIKEKSLDQEVEAASCKVFAQLQKQPMLGTNKDALAKLAGCRAKFGRLAIDMLIGAGRVCKNKKAFYVPDWPYTVTPGCEWEFEPKYGFRPPNLTQVEFDLSQLNQMAASA
jgi:hypothetical protein